MPGVPPGDEGGEVRQIYLHVGMPKAGSSSIQASLAGYEREGTRYAQLGAVNHTRLVAQALDPEWSVWPVAGLSQEEKLAKSEASLAALTSELRRPGTGALIISGEGISVLSFEQIKALKQLLDEYADRTVVLAYIREPVSFTASLIQQIVALGLDSSNLALPKYREKFEKFLVLFGQENVVFRSFSTEALVDGSVVSDFCAQVGIPRDAIVEQRTNDRLSLEAVQLLHCLNELQMFNDGNPHVRRARDKLVEFLRGKFPGTFQIDESDIRAHLDWADIRWMENACGFPLLTEGKAPAPSLGWQEQVRTINRDLIEKMRDELAGLNIPTGASEDLAMLITKLLVHLLLAGLPETGKQAN